MAKLDDSFLDREDSYYMMLLLLYTVTDDPKYSVLAELIYLLDRESFTNFFKYYEGQTIKIPTKEEMIDAFGMLQAFQLKYIDKMKWSDVAKTLGLNGSQSRTYDMKTMLFKQIVDKKNYKIGGVIDNANRHA